MQVKMLTSEERMILHRIILKGEDYVQFRQAVIILYSDLGMDPEELMRLAQADEETVASVIEAFNSMGMSYVDHQEVWQAPMHLDLHDPSIEDWSDINIP